MRILFFILLVCLTVLAQAQWRPALLGILNPRATAGSAPAAPSSLIATGDATGITIHWTDNSSTETGFFIEANEENSGWFLATVSGELGCDAPINPTPANVTSTTNYVGCTGQGTQASLCGFKFRVLATNSSGASSYTAEVQIIPSLEMSNLDAVIDVGVEVHLSWSSTFETGGNCVLKIYRSINNAAYILLDTLTDGDNETYDDFDADTLVALGLSQPVKYKLRQENEGGNGPYSNIATAHL